jgi:hypothetical protein
MLDATDFRTALIILATIAAENESDLREWSKLQELFSELYKEELYNRSTELESVFRSASERGKRAVNIRLDKPGGYRELKRRVQLAWASGKYKTKTACAMAAQSELGLSHSAALKALRSPRKKRAATP